MISQIRGTVLSIAENSLVIDVNGVGFKILVPTPMLASLSSGSEQTLQTVLIVRDDALTLYGFNNANDRNLFEQLITVSGVGPKVALSLLSSFASADLRLAIAQGDANLLATTPGIGKKTAQRIIVELKGAFEAAMAGNADNFGAAPVANDVTEALLAMGFSAQEATLAIKGYTGAEDDTNALLKHALKRLGS